MDTNYILQLIIQAKDEYSSQLKKVESELEWIKKTTQEVWNKSNQVVSFIKNSIAKLGLSALIIKTTKSIVWLADNLEKAQIAFTTMLWSEEKAVDMLNQLSDFAKRTPFEITWIRESAQQLIAMWVNANDIIPTLKSLWDVSAWLSVPLSRLALNYWQVIAQWKLTWRELRDFTMAWVPLLEELSNQLGKTTTQIQDMISKGQISSNDVIQAFQNMTSEWWRFADLMGKQANTLSWMWSNFQDWLTQLWEQIGSELLPTLKGYMSSLWSWLDNNIDNIKALASEIVSITKLVADNIISVVSTVTKTVIDWISETYNWFQLMLNYVLQANSDTATWVMGDWTDLFYFFQLWFTAVAWIVKTALSVIIWYFKLWIKNTWDLIGSLGQVFSALWEDAKEWARSMATSWVNAFIDLVNWVLEKLEWLQDQVWILTWERIWWKINRVDYVDFWWWNWWRLKAQLEWLAVSFKQNFDEYVWDVKDTFNNSLNEVLNVYGKRLEKTSKQVWTVTQSITQDLKSAVAWVDESLSEAWLGSSWSSKKAIEETDEALEQLIKEMEEYWKETMKMKEATYEWIIDSMEEAVKTAEKLSDEIASLQDKITELNRKEEVDIAKKYVEAEEKLRSMEREYDNITQAAREYASVLDQYKSWDELWWFKVKDLEEYLRLQKELTSAYSWLSDEQKKALDEQIEKQKEYNSLTDIEKIKADYEEKRAELQQELDEKIQLLNEEINKYQELSEKKIEYENEWLDYMSYSYKEQRDMYSKLISQAERLIALKAQAWLWWVDRRAWWGIVYSWNAYLVWEHWPELFTPSSRWMITPNNQITNNNWIEINISWVSVRNDNDIQNLADEIVRRIKLEKQFWIN